MKTMKCLQRSNEIPVDAAEKVSDQQLELFDTTASLKNL